ncbi:MAG: hypothetical protein RQ736_02745 [Thiogranum sp.]|nr:hypothetical protein [Thiogranum sp.]
MKRRIKDRHRQYGAASLLVALVLMMSITVITLAVARTGLYEQRMAANDHWNVRLSLHAEAALARVRHLMLKDLDSLAWHPQQYGEMQISQVPDASEDPDIEVIVELKRSPDARDLVLIEATARRRDGSGLAAHAGHWARRLSILTPLGETAPPLVLNGCISGEAAGSHIRPWRADMDNAGTAAWLSSRGACTLTTAVDLHGGELLEANLGRDLWSDLFSIDRETFGAFATAEKARPQPQRRYYQALPGDLVGGRWARSLGSPSRHVALYFPAALGCPEFAPGVRIFGIAFIDSGCSSHLAQQRLEIYGSLIINGGLDATAGQLRLNHISLADQRYTQLHFPILRSVPVPGSWSDF